MLLKKQTVWLLTMLSLVVVLSIYYVTSDPKESNLANVNAPATGKETNTAGEKDIKIITEASGDEAFETMRLDIQEKRGRQMDELTEKLGSAELTAEERDKLYVQKKEIEDYAVKEQLIESLIKPLGSYSDVLVRTEGDQVKITVKTEGEHSRADAVKILNTVRGEIGTDIVATVTFE